MPSYTTRSASPIWKDLFLDETSAAYVEARMHAVQADGECFETV